MLELLNKSHKRKAVKKALKKLENFKRFFRELEESN